jgi:hypothetical protein
MPQWWAESSKAMVYQVHHEIDCAALAITNCSNADEWLADYDLRKRNAESFTFKMNQHDPIDDSVTQHVRV